ncbi:MAG: cytosine permease [Thermoleophilia bacterium]|nr:cytosine permease [Gaiellaceae bacterium]MDW8338856.1 cytosine permease [Thermoleophilia bacterium]
MAATSPSEAVPATDVVGRIETHGVDFIPEEERHSRPSELWYVFVAGNLAFSVIVFGWLPIVFGLGWWSAVTSILVGNALGAIMAAPLALFGPRTGTNGVVSSGAHFGVRGRLVGTLLQIAFSLLYAAISIWTGGDALVASATRLVGTPDGDVTRALGYAVMALVIVAVAVYGHATLIALQRVLLPILAALIALGVVALGDDFDPGYAGGEYLLGGFWATWALAVVVAAAGPISYAGLLSDYTRYVSRARHSDADIFLAAAGSIFVGLVLASLFGAFTATTLADLETDYVPALIAEVPGWYVLAILLVGVLGGISQGVINLYDTGLSTDSLIPRLTRAQATVLASLAAIALVYAGTVVFDAVDSITAATLLLNACAVPWVTVMVLGLVVRRGRYDPQALQVFNEGRSGGAYWFTAGFNLRAVAAWAIGSAVGLLCVQSELYTGRWADVARGIDVTIPASGLTAAAVYLVLLALVPERLPAPAPAR